MNVELFVVSSYILLMSGGSLVTSPFSFLILAIFFFFSFVRDLLILLIFSKNELMLGKNERKKNQLISLIFLYWFSFLVHLFLLFLVFFLLLALSLFHPLYFLEVGPHIIDLRLFFFSNVFIQCTNKVRIKIMTWIILSSSYR